MREFEYVTSDERLIELTEHFSSLGSVAVDFEEECNLHLYGEHISIIQIYDRKNYYIVDVLSDKISKKGLEAFFTSSFEKIWFECHSDLAILYKRYGIKANGVYDIRVLARALGEIHGLDCILREYLGIEASESKKKNQRENWMKRPLEKKMLEYALKDVEYLFDLKEVLLDEVRNKKLLRKVDDEMKRVSIVKPSKPGWMKICNVNALSRDEREYLKHIFNAREKIAKRFNTPAVNVLAKSDIISLAKASPMTGEEIDERLEKAPKRYRHLLKDEIVKATKAAEKGIKEKKAL